MRNIFLGILSLLAIAFTANEALAINGNVTEFGPPQAYTPTFVGQTDNPGTPVYSTQFGRYYVLGNEVYVEFKVVSTSLGTKTTTADLFAVSLPLASATVSGAYQTLSCNVENATDVTSAWLGEIGSNTSQVTFRNQLSNSNSRQITWATTSPGIGVLSNTITAQCSGWYESSLGY